MTLHLSTHFSHQGGIVHVHQLLKGGGPGTLGMYVGLGGELLFERDCHGVCVCVFVCVCVCVLFEVF